MKTIFTNCIKKLFLISIIFPVFSYAQTDCSDIIDQLYLMRDNNKEEFTTLIDKYRNFNNKDFQQLWQSSIDLNANTPGAVSNDEIIKCLAKDFRKNGIKVEAGIVGEVFDADNNDDSESGANIFLTALFPALYVRETKSKNSGNLTLQGEVDWAIYNDEAGALYDDNEVFIDLGLFLPLGVNQSFYNPYVLPIDTISLNLSATHTDSKDTSRELSFNYQKYSKSAASFHDWTFRGGFGFFDDSEVDGPTINIELDNRRRYKTKNSNVLNEFILPRISYSYFNPGSGDDEEYNSIITGQVSWRHIRQKTAEKKFIVELSLGNSWELNDDLNEDSLFGFLSLSWEFYDDDNIGGSGGGSRGRRVRP